MHSVSVVITSTGCDSDGDGAPDSTDNCAGLANSDQADWDGDGLGNACDSTPGSAPPPPPVPTAPPVTAPAPPGTTSGCAAGCAYARTVDLRYKAARHRLVGSVASPAAGCRGSVPVTLWLKRSGTDRKLVVVTTAASGAFRTKAPRAAGRYYATVSSADHELCASGSSPVVRIRRR